MKSPFRPGHLILLAALALSGAALPLAAQTLTLEQARELRQDAQTAQDALGRAAQNPGKPELINDAKNAIARVSDRLDAYIAQFKKTGDPDDIYDHGNKYAPLAGVFIKDFDVPVGATVVNVPVTLDKPTPNNVIAYIRLYNGRGGSADPDTTKSVIFRTGDPLTKTVSFNVRNMNAGNTVKVVQPNVPDGAKRLSANATIVTAREGAVNDPIKDDSRAPLAFAPLGALCYSVTGQTIKFDDRGGPDTFSTSLAHGRTQVGNGETGYYGPMDMGGFARTPDGLVLSSRRLDKPVEVGAPVTQYPFLATMLSGHRTTGAQFKYGSVAWEVKMSNRRGSWPALWLLPVSGWPPEIDVYEGFGYSGYWKFSSDLSTCLHGGHNLIHKFSCPAMRMKMSTFGLSDTLDTAFHTFAVTVDPKWITMFVDGVETMRYSNPFKGETWYPLTNVAVKAKVDSPYNDGSGDMTLRSLKVWRAE